MVKDQHPQAVKEAIGTVLPIWLEAFKILLNIDPTSDVSNSENWDGLAVRIQIFKVRNLEGGLLISPHYLQTLSMIYISFPKAIDLSLVTDFLAASINHLNALFPTFAHYYINSEDSVPITSEDDTIELPQLVSSIFDFMSTVARHGKTKGWLEVNLQQIIFVIFGYAQITKDDVRDLLTAYTCSQI